MIQIQHVDWYLLARVRESSREKLAAALRLVAEEGIGARRSCGGGMFLYHPPTPVPASLAMVGEVALVGATHYGVYTAIVVDMDTEIITIRAHNQLSNHYNAKGQPKSPTNGYLRITALSIGQK